MIQGRFISEQKDLMIAEEIYRRVDFTQNESGAENDQKGIIIHALVYEGVDDTCPVAAGCMIIQSTEARLLKVAVLPEYRGKSYGEFLIRMLIDKAENSGITHITINSKKSISEYLHKQGFKESEGETAKNKTEEVKMIYKADTRKCCAKLI